MRRRKACISLGAATRRSDAPAHSQRKAKVLKRGMERRGGGRPRPPESRQRLIRWAFLRGNGGSPTCVCNQATSRFRFTNRILKPWHPSHGLPFFCQTEYT